MATPQHANAPLLHRFLGIGMTLLAAVFVGLLAFGIGPLLKETEGDSSLLGYMIAGLAVIIIAVARLVLKPRVPERRLGQSALEYWSSTETAGRIVLVWFLLEGGSILAAIAFLLTGLPAAGIVMAAGIALFWLTGPNAFGGT